MATSGSIDFSVTALFVIEQAFSKAGVKRAEQELQDHEVQDGLDSLNLMVKAWQAQGLHLWTKQEGVLFLDVSKTDYKLGVGGDEATNFDDFISTTTNTAEIALATVIGVTSSTGMLVADTIGILQDDDTRHWTTIKTVDSATQVTITTGLVSAAASGNTVFTYTNLLERPLRILSSRNAKSSSDNEFEIRKFARNEYFNQSNKTATGAVTKYYYSPQLGTGRFYVWPTAANADDFIRFTFERNIEDFDTTSNSPDFPIEWAETIIWNLALRLAVDYNTPIQKQQLISVNAAAMLDKSLGFDEEPTSLNISPRRN